LYRERIGLTLRFNNQEPERMVADIQAAVASLRWIELDSAPRPGYLDLRLRSGMVRRVVGVRKP
jgi:hypothetical protein